MRRAGKFLATLLLWGPLARGEGGLPGPTDPLLESCVRDALERRPELAQGSAQVNADRERISQLSALPDPVLTLGIQNDGFTRYSIGKMETSWYTVMASQAFPWPGKLALRADVARLQPGVADAALRRSRLTVEADVRRAYVELVLVRDQLRLLGRLGALWEQSKKLAMARYTVGEAPQSDLLRAQLEITRLRLQRLALEAREQVVVQTLNRARVHPLTESIAATSTLEQLRCPEAGSAAQASADAEARSPELLQARLERQQTERRFELARAEQKPDFSVAAGVMPRGALEPMWQLLVGVTLPVYAHSKQDRAVAEASLRRDASNQAEQATLQLLQLRTVQRLAVLEALGQVNRLYRDALLVQSEATATSTLAQYGVGRVPFSSALEALGGYLSDQGAYLESMAEALRVSIAQFEVSLEEPANGGAGGRGPSMSGGGARGTSATSAMGPGSPEASPSSNGSGAM